MVYCFMVSVQSCGQNRYRGGVPVPPANPPGEERSPGKGNPFPESPPRRRRRFPASKRHRRPGTNPSPILRERFGVSFRFTVHAAEADDNRREIPPIPPLCCHTFVLLHTRLNSYISCKYPGPGVSQRDRSGRKGVFPDGYAGFSKTARRAGIRFPQEQ